MIVLYIIGGLLFLIVAIALLDKREKMSHEIKSLKEKKAELNQTNKDLDELQVQLDELNEPLSQLNQLSKKALKFFSK